MVRGEDVGLVGLVGLVGEELADTKVIPSAAEAVFPLASFTTNVKVLVPAFCGVPDKTPEVLKARPVLHAPEHCVMDHVYGDVPPFAAREVLYGFPAVPLGRGLGDVIAKDVVRTLANALVLPTTIDVPMNMAHRRPETFRLVITEFALNK